MPPGSSVSEARPILNPDMARSFAKIAGFAEAGAVTLPQPNADRDAERFERWIEAGHSGSMEYLARRNEQGAFVRSRVSVPFPWARSVIVCLAGYHADAPLSTEPSRPEAGWIARYAWSGRKDEKGETRPSDYHKVLLKQLKALESALQAEVGPFESRAYVDTGPVVERQLAHAAGLGWTGKNTCLIHPKLGSWNFLAVLVTSLDLRKEDGPLMVPDRCGSCRRCLDACPTQALIAPYQMDATRCISYLTIEHKGDLPEDLMAGMGRQVFGCDICQDVCPWNRKAPVSQNPDLAPRRELINPDLEWLALLEESDFERLCNGSPIRRTGFAGFRRNVAVAMGNSGLPRYLPILERWAADPETTGDGKKQTAIAALKWAARWAAVRLSAPRKKSPGGSAIASTTDLTSN